MPRFPTEDELRPPKSYETGRGVVSFTAGSTGAGEAAAAVGKGVAALGKSIGNIGQDMQDRDDAAGLASAELERVTEQHKLRDQFDSDAEPGTLYDRALPAYKDISERAAAKIPNAQRREAWRAKAAIEDENAAARWGDVGQKRVREAQDVDLQRKLADLRTRAGDPRLSDAERADLERTAKDAIAVLVRGNVVSQQRGYHLEKEHIGGMVEDHYLGRAERGDAWQLLDEIEARGAPRAAVPGSTDIRDGVDPNAPYMKRPRNPKNIKSIVVHGDVNEDAEALRKYGLKVDRSRGFDPNYHYIVPREDDKPVIRSVPDDRVANHTLGQNRDSIGIVIAGADDGKPPTPAQERKTRALISQLGRKYGIDPKNVHGHGEIQNNRHRQEGGTVAKQIRERGYDPEPETRAPGSPPPAEGAGSTEPGSESGPSPDDGPAPEGSRLSTLSPDRLRALRYNVRKTLIDRVQDELKSDELRLLRGIEPEKDDKGRTAVDRARRVLQKNQVATAERLHDRARRLGRAIHGDGGEMKPLHELSDAELSQRFIQLSPDAKAPEESYRTAAEVQEKFQRFKNKALDVRAKDPAETVDPHPENELRETGIAAQAREVRAAYARIERTLPGVRVVRGRGGEIGIADDPNTPPSHARAARGLLIDGRLEAQTARGITRPRTITKREAQALFEGLNFEEADETTYQKQLKTVADRAEALYGQRHAGAVFHDAIVLEKLKKSGPGTADARAGMIRKLTMGGELSRYDFERLRHLRGAEAAERAFAEPEPGPAEPLAAEPSLEWGGAYRGVVPADGTPRRPPERKEPNAGQKEWIRKNPDQWKEFDGKFYPGAAAKALGVEGTQP